jgi:hypothetical protein
MMMSHLATDLAYATRVELCEVTGMPLVESWHWCYSLMGRNLINGSRVLRMIRWSFGVENLGWTLHLMV